MRATRLAWSAIVNVSDRIEADLSLLREGLVSSAGLPIGASLGPSLDASGALSWSPRGLIAPPGSTPPGEPTRHVNVPPEAFPILDPGVDGCHYALWIDDPLADATAPVVWVSPADPVPETVRVVTSSATAFLELLGAGGFELVEGEGSRERHRIAATHVRAKVIARETLSSLGVVVPPEPPAERPGSDLLARWSRDRDAVAVSASITRWLARGCPGLALAVCHDLLVGHAGFAIPGFGEQLAAVYESLGRGQLATIASSSYR